MFQKNYSPNPNSAFETCLINRLYNPSFCFLYFMKCELLSFTETLIFSIKAGRPLSSTLEAVKKNNPFFFEKNKILNQTDYDPKHTMSYELSLIINRGLAGLPILKMLEDFHERTLEKIDFIIEEHSKKAPFLAMIPLFIFQVPSLLLLFFYPLIDQFLSEMAK